MQLRNYLLSLAALGFSGAAMAHSGGDHVHGFNAGMAHPLLGIDHLLVMLAVGLWSVQQGGQRIWQLPLAFVLTMLLGGALGMNGLVLSWMETGIAVSLAMIGLLLVFAVRLPTMYGALFCAAMALLHGMAHGSELPASVSPLAYAAGFALASSLLHLSGMALGRVSGRILLLLRLAGGGMVLTGAGLILA